MHGGPENLAHLLRFVADTVLLEGFGFDPPGRDPDRTASGGRATRHDDRPLVGVVFYRAHLVAGNTQFVDDLCDALEAARRRRAGRVVLLAAGRRGPARARRCCAGQGLDVLITTVLAAGGVGRRRRHRTAAPAGSTATTWDASALAALDVPIIQAPSSGQSVADVAGRSDGGLGPYDATAGVAIPEFDGRIIGPVFAFNEVVDDGDELGTVGAGLPHGARPGRAGRRPRRPPRPAPRRTPPAERRVAIVLSAPTRPSAAGSATPSASTRRRRRMRPARTPCAADGYRVDRIARPTATS